MQFLQKLKSIVSHCRLAFLKVERQERRPWWVSSNRFNLEEEERGGKRIIRGRHKVTTVAFIMPLAPIEPKHFLDAISFYFTFIVSHFILSFLVRVKKKIYLLIYLIIFYVILFFKLYFFILVHIYYILALFPSFWFYPK